MNRKQIKQQRLQAEKRIDYLMGIGYGGSEDSAFMAACAECRELEERLKMLAAAADNINAKSRMTRRTNPYVNRGK